MKLAQLQEARYHGEHPIITELKDMIFKQTGEIKKEWTLTDQSFDYIVDELSSHFGSPEISPPDERHKARADWDISLPSRECWITVTQKRKYLYIEVNGDHIDAFTKSSI